MNENETRADTALVEPSPESGPASSTAPERARGGLGGAVRNLAGRPALGIVVLVVAALYILFGAGAFNQYQASLVLVFAVAALGQDWLIGRAGQISLGAAAFMAVGAFVAARTSTESWAPFPVPIILAAVAGAVIGLVVGLAGLRFRGLYLALSTLALQFIVSFAAERYQGKNEAGFVAKIPSLFGYSFRTVQRLDLLFLVVLAIVLLALGGLYRRAPGRAWAAIRQNEVAAAVAGVDVRRWKLLAFIGSSAVIAVAGALFAYQSSTVTYIPFSLSMAVSVLVMVFVGGLGSMTGAVIGAAFVELLPHWIQQITDSVHVSGDVNTWLSTNGAELALAIYGLALVLVLLFERRGVVGLLNRLEGLVLWIVRRLRPKAVES
jgi:branched-chain amino acid transport system permease protein